MIRMKDGSVVEDNSWMNPLKDIIRLNKYKHIKKQPYLETRLLNLLYSGDFIPSKMSIWSKKIKKRDKECVICGNKKKLNSHHIIYKSVSPQLQYNINNGITLCINCHADTHLSERPEKLIRSKLK